MQNNHLLLIVLYLPYYIIICLINCTSNWWLANQRLWLGLFQGKHRTNPLLKGNLSLCHPKEEGVTKISLYPKNKKDLMLSYLLNQKSDQSFIQKLHLGIWVLHYNLKHILQFQYSKEEKLFSKQHINHYILLQLSYNNHQAKG